MKRIRRLLLIGYDCLPTQEKKATIAEVKTKCLHIFKSHIGEGNGITPVKLFEELFDIVPVTVTVYEKAYLWNNVIKKALSELRSEGSCFVRNAGQKLYVIQNQEEAEKYKKRLQQNIQSNTKLQAKADQWVATQGWKKL